MSESPRAAAGALEAEPPALVTDTWHAHAWAADGAQDVDLLIATRFSARWARAAQRHASVRGALWFAASLGARRIVCTPASRGLHTCLLLHLLLSIRPPRLYLLEVLRPAPAGLAARWATWWQTRLLRLVLPRLLAAAQVMVRSDAQACARLYGLPARRFRFIPYPLRVHVDPAVHGAPPGAPRVLALGPAGVDWTTLMRAAHQATWPLTVVCTDDERAQVDARNPAGRARVLSGLSLRERHRLMAEATLCVMPLRAQHGMAAQAFLAQAMAMGVPVVATAVAGLSGYLEDGRDGVAVPVGDARALREAVDALWRDDERRECLRHSARQALLARSLPDYLGEVRALLDEDDAG